MIKSKELIGPSCLTNAKDDEPLFVLRANDELAPKIVRAWALDYHNSKCQQNWEASHADGSTEHKWALNEAQTAKYREANALADQMEAWRLGRNTDCDDRSTR